MCPEPGRAQGRRMGISVHCQPPDFVLGIGSTKFTIPGKYINFSPEFRRSYDLLWRDSGRHWYRILHIRRYSAQDRLCRIRWSQEAARMGSQATLVMASLYVLGWYSAAVKSRYKLSPVVILDSLQLIWGGEYSATLARLLKLIVM